MMSNGDDDSDDDDDDKALWLCPWRPLSIIVAIFIWSYLTPGKDEVNDSLVERIIWSPEMVWTLSIIYIYACCDSVLLSMDIGCSTRGSSGEVWQRLG